MTDSDTEKKQAWVQWRIKPSIKRKLDPYIRDRQLSHLLDTLVGTYLKDSTGIDAMREENRKLLASIHEAHARIAANEARIHQMELAAQQTEVIIAAESRFRDVVKSRDPRRMDVTMWRNLATDHPTAQNIKPEARKRIIMEEVGVEL